MNTTKQKIETAIDAYYAAETKMLNDILDIVHQTMLTKHGVAKQIIDDEETIDALFEGHLTGAEIVERILLDVQKEGTEVKIVTNFGRVLYWGDADIMNITGDDSGLFWANIGRLIIEVFA